MTFRKSLAVILLLELLIAVLAVSFYGWGIESLQATTRFSGRLSLFIFSTIFILLPYHREKLSQILSNKFFLLFAIAHAIHLVELLNYIYLSGGKLIPTRLAGGALAYAMIFFMPFIESKLKERKKTIIQNIYVFYVWFILFMTYLPRVQGKLKVGGTFTEFVTLFTWVCLLLVIRVILFLIQRKSDTRTIH